MNYIEVTWSVTFTLHIVLHGLSHSQLHGSLHRITFKLHAHYTFSRFSPAAIFYAQHKISEIFNKYFEIGQQGVFKPEEEATEEDGTLQATRYLPKFTSRTMRIGEQLCRTAPYQKGIVTQGTKDQDPMTLTN